MTASHVVVVTRTKNRPVMLARAAASVIGQRHPNLTWVVVNDGGDPAEVDAIVGTHAGALRTVVVHHPVSLGMEAASNKGVAAAVGDYVVIHDDDDTWLPDFLNATSAFLDENGSFDGVVTGSVHVDEVIEAGGVIRELSTKPWNPMAGFAPVGAVQVSEMARMNQFPPIAFLFRRDAWSELGGFSEDLPVLGDWDFNLRFIEKRDIGVIGRPLARYHHRPATGSTDASYGNSVLSTDRHARFDAIVRNRMLRRDLAAGKPGMGMLVTMGRLEHGTRELVAPGALLGAGLVQRLRPLVRFVRRVPGLSRLGRGVA